MKSLRPFAMPINTVIALLLCLSLIGCSSQPRKDPGEIPPQRSAASLGKEELGELSVIDQYDPLEGLNRNIYRFNAWFDEAVFLPLAGLYDFVLPDPVQDGVHNFVRNVDDIGTLFNSLLQLKGRASLDTAGRLLINTTLGVLGLFDPASAMGITRHDEDFGQTLGRYGLGPGPYLVLPILGPSSLRDGAGLVADNFAFNELDPLYFDSNDDAWRWGYPGVAALETRDRLAFRYFETGSPFEYELLRLLYLEKRKLEIAR